MKPGAFDKFLRNHKRVPMKFMHEIPCGVWDSLKETDRGLEVSGLVTDPTFARLVTDTSEFRELSISFRDPARLRTPLRINSYGIDLPPPLLELEAAAQGYRVVEHQTVPVAGLAEISIVDSGAFPGTYLTFV
jgi:hypothetical protein